MTKEFIREEIKSIMQRIKYLEAENPNSKELPELYKRLELFTEALGK